MNGSVGVEAWILGWNGIFLFVSLHLFFIHKLNTYLNFLKRESCYAAAVLGMVMSRIEEDIKYLIFEHLVHIGWHCLAGFRMCSLFTRESISLEMHFEIKKPVATSSSLCLLCACRRDVSSALCSCHNAFLLCLPPIEDSSLWIVIQTKLSFS